MPSDSHSKEKTPSVSLCMMVKNEEGHLPRCLESVKGWVDEMIVVDTGSTDETVEIARSFGAKIFHHPWENDFSKHRNQSIGYATGDWILILDGDEVCSPGAEEAIRGSIEQEEADSLFVTVVCYFEGGSRSSWHNSLRVFKNHKGIHFEGIVHNQLTGYVAPRFCHAKICNYGYDIDQSQVRKKFERTSTLLKKSIEADPSNFRHHHDLAISYASMGFFRKAIDSGLTAMELHERQGLSDPNILWTHFAVATAYYNLNAMAEAELIIGRALEINGDYLDAYFLLASIGSARRDKNAFEDAYGQFVRLEKIYRASPGRLAGLVVSKLDEKWRLDLDYGFLLLGEGALVEARNRLQMAVEDAPDAVTASRLASMKCRDAGFFALAEAFLLRAGEAGLGEGRRRLDEALIKKARGNDSEYISILEEIISDTNECSPELCKDLGVEALRIGKSGSAERFLKTAIGHGFHQPQIYTSLGLACKYQGKLEEAMWWNLKALEIDDSCLGAHVNLGHLHYDRQNWAAAKEQYEKAASLGGPQRDVLFRLSVLSLMEGQPERSLEYCRNVLEAMGMVGVAFGEGISGFANLYRRLGEGFCQTGEKRLHQEAMNLVLALERGGSEGVIAT